MESLTIRTQKWKLWLLGLGMLAFVIAGLGLLLGETSPSDKMMGLVCLLFFGLLGFRALRSILGKGGGTVIVSDKGIVLTYPDSPPMPILWEEIEGFGTHRMKTEVFTTVMLSSYDGLVQRLKPEDAKRFLRKVRYMRGIAKLIALSGLIKFEDRRGALKVMPKSEELKEFSGYLAQSREQYGGEFLISWNMRDRSAENFARFLEAQKSQCLGESEWVDV